jgi:hypothetical protein
MLGYCKFSQPQCSTYGSGWPYSRELENDGPFTASSNIETAYNESSITQSITAGDTISQSYDPFDTTTTTTTTPACLGQSYAPFDTTTTTTTTTTTAPLSQSYIPFDTTTAAPAIFGQRYAPFDTTTTTSTIPEVLTQSYAPFDTTTSTRSPYVKTNNPFEENIDAYFNFFRSITPEESETGYGETEVRC